jgi:hypothetical protein
MYCSSVTKLVKVVLPNATFRGSTPKTSALFRLWARRGLRFSYYTVRLYAFLPGLSLRKLPQSLYRFCPLSMLPDW